VYRIVRVNDRSIEISIGVLPSGTQQAVANLELSVDGNIMSGLLRSTQIDDTPQNWVLRRSAEQPPKTVTPPPATSDSAAKTPAPAVPQDKLPAGVPTRQSQSVRLAGDVRALAFAPDGKLLAAGGSDNIIRTWITTNRQDWQESRQFGQASQRSAVEAIALAPEARLLASAHLDGAARIWDLETGRLVQTLNHGGIVYAVAFSRDGRSLFTGGFDKSVRLWNVDSGRQERSIEAGMDIRVLALSPDGRWLALGGSGKQIKLWDVSGWRLARTLDSPPGNWVVNSLAYSPDGQKLAAAIADGHMKLWDVEGGELRSGRAGSPLTFAAKGAWMALALDGKISLQDVISGREIGVLAGHSEKIDAIAASPDGRWLASGDGSGTIKFWQ
jgi:WD40 repeat protein